MKKIFALMSAAVLALGFTACSSDAEEAIEGGVAKQIKLNITVSNLDEEAGTRAIKQGWVSGDKINVWFDATNTNNPDLILAYNGSEWSVDTWNTTPAASGNLIVLYEGYNDWSAYTLSSGYLYPKTYQDMSTYVYAQPIAYVNNGTISYTYDAGTSTISFDLNSWRSLTKVQVVVTGLDANASNYALKETNMTKGVVYLGGSSIAFSNSSVGGYTLGVSNADGVAFNFFGHNNGSYAANWTFTLKDIEANTEKTYSVSDKAFPTSAYKIKGIKIAASKFE